MPPVFHLIQYIATVSNLYNLIDCWSHDQQNNFYYLSSFFVAIECEPLPPIANGLITYGDDTTPNFDLGTTATYECNEGFFLDLSVGVRVRTCVDDNDMDALGVFTDQAPTCVRKSPCNFLHRIVVFISSLRIFCSQ